MRLKYGIYLFIWAIICQNTYCAPRRAKSSRKQNEIGYHSFWKITNLEPLIISLHCCEEESVSRPLKNKNFSTPKRRSKRQADDIYNEGHNFEMPSKRTELSSDESPDISRSKRTMTMEQLPGILGMLMQAEAESLMKPKKCANTEMQTLKSKILDELESTLRSVLKARRDRARGKTNSLESNLQSTGTFYPTPRLEELHDNLENYKGTALKALNSAQALLETLKKLYPDQTGGKTANYNLPAIVLHEMAQETSPNSLKTKMDTPDSKQDTLTSAETKLSETNIEDIRKIMLEAILNNLNSTNNEVQQSKSNNEKACKELKDKNVSQTKENSKTKSIEVNSIENKVSSMELQPDVNSPPNSPSKNENGRTEKEEKLIKEILMRNTEKEFSKSKDLNKPSKKQTKGEVKVKMPENALVFNDSTETDISEDANRLMKEVILRNINTTEDTRSETQSRSKQLENVINEIQPYQPSSKLSKTSEIKSEQNKTLTNNQYSHAKPIITANENLTTSKITEEEKSEKEEKLIKEILMRNTEKKFAVDKTKIDKAKMLEAILNVTNNVEDKKLISATYKDKERPAKSPDFVNEKKGKFPEEVEKQSLSTEIVHLEENGLSKNSREETGGQSEKRLIAAFMSAAEEAEKASEETYKERKEINKDDSNLQKQRKEEQKHDGGVRQSSFKAEDNENEINPKPDLKGKYFGNDVNKVNPTLKQRGQVVNPADPPKPLLQGAENEVKNGGRCMCNSQTPAIATEQPSSFVGAPAMSGVAEDNIGDDEDTCRCNREKEKTRPQARKEKNLVGNAAALNDCCAVCEEPTEKQEDKYGILRRLLKLAQDVHMDGGFM